ncbi:MAG: GNAT family N-acetyltransferase [Terracidiphilus sp.]|jgi:ribosomal protein S18 acetylase RimI-like enzyme
MPINSNASSSSPVGVRLATEADRPRLISLINSAYSIETFLDGTRTDDDRLAATMQEGEILVAETPSGEILGCVYTEVRGNRGYIGQLAVDPAHQGSGLARRLAEAAEDRFRALGCQAVDITVLSLRPELPRIYRRYGYIETGTEPFHMTQALKDQAECHCIVMSKRL